MPRTLDSLGTPVIQVPPVTSKITPLSAYSIPSVTMMEGMRPSVTRVPLIAPQRAPTATAAKSGSTNPPVLCAAAPPATAHRPSIEPVEMSISPQRTTWLTARAMIPSTATEVRIASRLVTLRNLPLKTEKTTTSKIRKASAGASGRRRYRRKPAPLSVPAAWALASLSLGNLLLGAACGRGHNALLGRLSPRELAGDTALAHHQDAVSHREYFLQFGGNEQDGLTLLRQVVHEAVDLRLCPDIDAPRGLVQQQHVRLSGERLGDDYLLLVAPREPAHRVGDPGSPYGQFSHVPVRDAAFRPGYEPEPRDAVEDAQGDVVLYRERQDEPLGAALLGHVEYSLLHSGLRRVDPDLLPIDEDPTRVRPVYPEDGLGKFGTPGPDQPGEANDLPPAQREIHTLELTVTGEAPDLEGSLTRTALAAGEELVKWPAYHKTYELFGVEFRGLRSPDVVAVPEHGDAVGDLENLLQPVGDVDDADVLRRQVPDNAEQLPGLPLGQGGGRLVHNHGPRLTHEGPRDGHDLLLRRREPLYGRGGIQVDTKGRKPLARLLPHGLPVQAAPAGTRPLASDEQVLGHGELGK